MRHFRSVTMDILGVRRIKFSPCIALLMLLPAVTFAGERIFMVSGNSMSPALMAGDEVIAEDVQDETVLQRGDLIVIEFSHRERPVVKRVAAVAGDKVEFREGALMVNGETVRRIDHEKWKSTINQIAHYDNMVPINNILVLGDNAENSRDSARLGLISMDQMTGKILKTVTSNE